MKAGKFTYTENGDIRQMTDEEIIAEIHGHMQQTIARALLGPKVPWSNVCAAIGPVTVVGNWGAPPPPNPAAQTWAANHIHGLADTEPEERPTVPEGPRPNPNAWAGRQYELQWLNSFDVWRPVHGEVPGENRHMVFRFTFLRDAEAYHARYRAKQMANLPSTAKGPTTRIAEVDAATFDPSFHYRF